MKVRIGIGTGTAVMTGDELAQLVDDLESNGFDSLWWSDVLTVPGDDPLAAMAYAAGHAPRLKIGTTMVLPGRNPVRLAKQLATLDRLSGGRLLVTFVLGLRRAVELDAMGVGAGDRGRQLDELLPLLRRLWTEDDVDHDGDARGNCTASPSSPSRCNSPSTSGWGAVSPARCAGAACSATDGSRRCAPPRRPPPVAVVIEDVAAEAGRRIDPSTSASASATRSRDPPEQLLGAVAGPSRQSHRRAPGCRW